MKHLVIVILLLSLTTQAQFRLVKDIYTGNNDSFPLNFENYNGKLFFGAINPVTDLQTIYVSDGTTVGTTPLVINFASNVLATATTYEPEFFKLNTDLYFSVRTPVSINNSVSYVVKVSGTSTTTNLVYNLSANTQKTNSSFSNAVILNNKIVFNPRYAESFLGGIEPYVIDLNNASNSGVLKDINISNDSNPTDLTVFAGSIFFAAKTNSTNTDMYKSNGLTSGTSVFLNATNGFPNTSPANFKVLGNSMIFTAFTVQYGNGLYKTTGATGNWSFLANAAYSNNLKVIDNLIYFSGNDGTNGQELWRTDGTVAGTYMVRNINVSGNSNPRDFIKIGNLVYFVAEGNNNTGGAEIWKTDGTQAGTQLVKEVNTNGSSEPTFLTAYNGTLYFVANDGIHGREIWTSNGTDAGTYIVELNVGGTGSDPSHLTVLNDELFFAADAGDGSGKELWAYKDPTLAINNLDEVNTAISVYPNATTSYFQIETQVTIEKVTVYSLDGKLIKSFGAQDQYDIAEVTSGTYILSIETKKGTFTKKLRKE